MKHLQLVEQHNLEHLDRVAGQEELYYWDFNLSPEYTLLYKELQQQISLVMSDLPSRCREVFEMSRFKKMKNREIADALQISTTAVEKHIAKALARFSAHFKDKYPLDVYIAILACCFPNERSPVSFVLGNFFQEGGWVKFIGLLYHIESKN